MTDERTPRPRRAVPTGLQFFGYLSALIAAGMVIQSRHALVAWWLSLPPVAFAWIAAFGAALALGALIVFADWAIDRIARRNAARSYRRVWGDE
jgi:4-hydroxybenzoate polyprenyltransferase